MNITVGITKGKLGEIIISVVFLFSLAKLSELLQIVCSVVQDRMGIAIDCFSNIGIVKRPKIESYARCLNKCSKEGWNL